MSTGKRLAKRSIIGTRVCAPAEDGKYYSGIIQAVKTPAPFPECHRTVGGAGVGGGPMSNGSLNGSNCINLTPNTRYTVKFDARHVGGGGGGVFGRASAEYMSKDLIGPGFRSVLDIVLERGQRVYVTYNGREVAGEVVRHESVAEEVAIAVCPPGAERPFEVLKKLEEVRLLESRKSARLADQDTDFARLADMAGDRKRTASHTIDVPTPSHYNFNTSRKRRPSGGHDESSSSSPKDPQMDECSAALVLMSLSGSPRSPHFSGISWAGTSPGSSSSASWRSSPSPPPREFSSPPIQLYSSSASDEGIVMDDPDELPRKKKPSTRIVYKCTWRGCQIEMNTCDAMVSHIRNNHLKKSEDESIPDGEEEFYFTEFEVNNESPPPTLSHRDMARPPHEDPEYQRQLVSSYRQQIFSGPINIPQSPHKLLKLSSPHRPHSPKMPPASPSRRVRGENKKCRKVYGMENKEQWCTQCKWKKACSRFGD